MVRPNHQPTRPRLLEVLRAAEAAGESFGEAMVRLARQAADEHRAQSAEHAAADADAAPVHEEARR